MSVLDFWRKRRQKNIAERSSSVSKYPVSIDSKTGIPAFKYYPDPIANGSITKSQKTCICCEKARGFVYTSTPYTREHIEPETICPWCIADGTATEKLDCSFQQDIEDDVPAEIAIEVECRTPGYETWQGEFWLTHCNDACLFLGEMTGDRFAAVPDEIFELHAKENGIIEAWRDARDNYIRGADASVYEFRCLHCGTIRLHADAS